MSDRVLNVKRVTYASRVGVFSVEPDVRGRSCTPAPQIAIPEAERRALEILVVVFFVLHTLRDV